MVSSGLLPIDSDKVVYAIAKNITYKKELEEERNIHLLNLQKSITNSSSPPYSTAHDNKSPVNNMLAAFELLDLSKLQIQKRLNLFHF
jgi:hypothetical protein